MERPRTTPEQGRIPTPLEVNFAGIPKELQEYQQWVVWKYALVDEELKKPPFSPQTGRHASVRQPATWGSLIDAQRAYETGQFAGVGFVLTTGIVGIDIDHCITGSQISEEAQEIISTLATYAEYSPSGTGVRLLLSGQLPGLYRRRGRIEMYQDARYLTITGQHLEGTPLTLLNHQHQLEAVYRRLFPSTPPHQGKENTGGGEAHYADRPSTRYFSDEAILQKAFHAKNGANFRRYYAGDYSLWEGAGARHRSQSEADFTLVLMLLYWTNRDSAQVERLFRQSGLMRPKWERPVKGEETYGQRLIADALRKGRT